MRQIITRLVGAVRVLLGFNYAQPFENRDVGKRPMGSEP